MAKKPKGFQQGDIVSLPELRDNQLAFALTPSHENNGELRARIYYLKIKILDDSREHRESKENTYYTLTDKDLQDIKTIGGDAQHKLSDFKGKRLRIFLGNEHFHHIKEDPLHGLFFHRIASTLGTTFCRNLTLQAFRDAIPDPLARIEAPAERKPRFARKAPPTVRAMQRSLDATVPDIHIDDAHKAKFFLDNQAYRALKAAKVERISTAKQLVESKDPTLVAAWAKITKGKKPFSALKDEVIELQREFLAHAMDDRRHELEANGIKISYPELS